MKRQRAPSQPKPPNRCGTRTRKVRSSVVDAPGGSGCGSSTRAMVRAPAGVSASVTGAGAPSARASVMSIPAGENSPGYSQ